MRSMEIVMDFRHIQSIEDLKRFITGSGKIIMRAVNIEDKYEVVNDMVSRFNYLQLSRDDKRVFLKALKILTGYKKSQLHTVIDMALRGKLERKAYKRINAYRKYTGHDIQLLEETDELHYRLSSAATHEILRREYELFGKEEYQNVSKVSISHINNLRNTEEYRAKYLHHTQARQVDIGQTRRPEPDGRPGSIRIDTVHQNSIYLINSIDEVTQWEVVAAVERISEEYMRPVLEQILKAYPFIIFNFHSDRGSEYVNYVVSQILERLRIKQSKSRSRHCNDQALVEGKNGHVIRKNFGYDYMNKGIIKQYNDFFEKWFNIYLNYHRPCGYVTEVRKDHKGREEKIYGEYTTPYEKLKEVIRTFSKEQILKPEITLEAFDDTAYKMSDNDFVKNMRQKQYELFDINNFLNRHSPIQG